MGPNVACQAGNIPLALATLSEIDFARFGSAFLRILPTAVALPTLAITEIFAVIGRSSDEWNIDDCTRRGMAISFLERVFPMYLDDSGKLASLLLFIMNFQCDIPIADRIGIIISKLTDFPDRMTTSRFVLALAAIDSETMCAAAVALGILNVDDFGNGGADYQEIVLTIVLVGISAFIVGDMRIFVIDILDDVLQNGPLFLRMKAPNILVNIGAQGLVHPKSWSFATTAGMLEIAWEIWADADDDIPRRQVASLCRDVIDIAMEWNMGELLEAMGFFE
jgi:hypothetical protein